MTIRSAMVWLQDTNLSTNIRESTDLWVILICVHAVSLGLSVGTIAVLDLRLVGWAMRGTPVTWIFERLRPWTLTGFAITFATGILLAISEPVKCYEKPSFYLKLLFIALAGVNALYFERRVYAKVAEWDTQDESPARAQFAGAASLALWSGAIFFGRWFAY